MDRTEDQIELIDALRVLWKYKLVILAGTLICIIAVGIISFMQPKIYRVDMVISPGVINAPKAGEIEYIDSSYNIKSIIQQGVLRNRMASYLERNGITNPPKSFNFRITIPRKTNIIKISSETQNGESGIAVLKALSAALSDFFAENSELLLREWNDKLNSLNSEISVLNLEAAAARKRIDIIKAIIAEIMEKLDAANKENNLQEFNARSKLNLRVLELTKLLDDAQVDLTRIHEEKKMKLNMISIIEQNKKQFKFIQILKPPKATNIPIKPKIKINLLMASLAGFLLMILLSFSFEYLRNQIYRPLDKKSIQTTEKE